MQLQSTECKKSQEEDVDSKCCNDPIVLHSFVFHVDDRLTIERHSNDQEGEQMPTNWNSIQFCPLGRKCEFDLHKLSYPVRKPFQKAAPTVVWDVIAISGLELKLKVQEKPAFSQPEDRIADAMFLSIGTSRLTIALI